jgi:hypothetical protein
MNFRMGRVLTDRLRVRLQRRGRRGSRRGLHFERLESRQLLHGAADLGLQAAEGEVTPRSDFSLQDVNATSPTYQQPVSPRDYFEQVSGWFFADGM